ncbi:chaperonin 10-like protein [Fusarium oxysporum]|nr:chaperonin 10-like protein [Fusarium oxysporum]
MPIPTSAQALVVRVDSNNTPKLVKEPITVPKPGKHQLLVKVSHVAQNPTDVQSFDGNAFGDGAVLGCDFVGVVEATGSDVTRITKGTTIAGLIWGGETKGLGGYSEYTLADDRICFPVPEGLSEELACTIPLASCTALLSLFSKDCLAIDAKADEKPTVLIWGGSSSVGLYAVQIARLHGLPVIATCSPKHHDLVKSYGAKEVFDYRDSHVVDNIRQAAPGLRYVFDTIGNENSSKTASSAITHSEGVLCTVRPGKANTEGVAEGVKVTDVLVWTAFLKEHRYGDFYWPPKEADYKLAAGYFHELPGLVSSGQIKPNTSKLVGSGLDSVPQGFQEYRDGKISNYKIVYRI